MKAVQRHLKWMGGVLLWLLLWNTYGMAQEEFQTPITPTAGITPTETQAASATPQAELPEFVVTYLGEFVSVEAMRFYFVLQPPAAQIEQATLTVTQNGWAASGQPIVVDVEGLATIADSYTEFAYIWTVDADNPPQLFEDLTFTWEFTLADERRGEVEQTVTYADPRAEWRVASIVQNRIRIVAPASTFNPETLPLEQVYDLLSANTGGETSLNVIVFSAALPLNPCDGQSVIIAPSSGEELPCDSEAIEAVYRESGYTPIQVQLANAVEVQDAVTRLLFDRLYTPLWSDDDVPEWFRYGLREFYTSHSKGDELETSRRSVRLNRALQDLSNVPEGEELTVWQAQSYGIVLYMAEQIGVPGLFDLARVLGEGESLEAAYQSATGQSITTLISTWSNWLFTRAAEQAYQYNPYLPDTPTPAPTATITLTPTRTLTLTPRIVVTPTITLTRTPTPTFTITNTQTPTLTVTPRPAGSLRTSTPLDAAVTEESADDNTSFILGIGVMVIGLIALLLLLFGFRSRT